jgi:hypothetical protein
MIGTLQPHVADIFSAIMRSAGHGIRPRSAVVKNITRTE